MTTFAVTRDARLNGVGTVLLAIAVVGIGFGTVNSPGMIAGAVLGCVVLAVAMLAPLALVAVMLMIGPVDLSFLTGGFKSLLPGMGGLDMNGIRLLSATAGFLAFIMIEPRARAAATRKSGLAWLVFLVYAASTLAISFDRLEGARLLLKLAYPFLTFLIVIGLCDSRARLYALVRYTLAAALIYALIVNPLLALNGGYRVEIDGTVRVGGLGIGDNPFAFYVTAMLMIVFTRFLVRRQWYYLVFSLVLVVWLALTGTRIAVLAAVVGLSAVGLLAALASGNRKALAGGLLAAAMLALVIMPNVLIRTFGFLPTPGELFNLLRSPIALFESVNWQGRQFIWAILWSAFMGAPIFGLGLGSSNVMLTEAFGEAQFAHNEYLRLATDGGIVGVILFAIASGSWFVMALRLSKHSDQGVREFAVPAVATLLVWAIIALTDNPFQYYTVFTQYVGFLVAGAVVMSEKTA